MKPSIYNLFILSSVMAVILYLLAIVILLVLALRAQHKRNLYSLELERQQIHTEQFRDYQQQYTILQNRRHDMKHHIRYIQELMERKEYEKLQAYVDSLIRELS